MRCTLDRATCVACAQLPPKHDRHTALRVIAGRVVVAADLLASRHVERAREGERGQPGVLGCPKAV